jgi:hypothetical protein
VVSVIVARSEQQFDEAVFLADDRGRSPVQEDHTPTL